MYFLDNIVLMATDISTEGLSFKLTAHGRKVTNLQINLSEILTTLFINYEPSFLSNFDYNMRNLSALLIVDG